MAEIVHLYPILDEHYRREGYRIVVSPGLWRGHEVTVEPPTSTHPLRAFKTEAEALRYAKRIGAVEGWPISVVGPDHSDGGHAA